MKPLTRCLLNDSGFTLLDVILTASILAFLSVAIMLSSITTSRSATIILKKSAAFQLASTKIEELAIIDPQQLNDSYDSLELALVAQGHEFTRQVDVSMNADGSRRVQVTVHSTYSSGDEAVTLQHTFALWGNN